jgi:cytoskeletal protein RodZ
MKTVGSILREKREKIGLSVDRLSAQTKIDASYITAIESDNYDKLPSETFTKGFIRNISIELGCDPQENLAIFRRDYRQASTQKTPISTLRNIRSSKFFHNQYILPFAGAFIFLVYLIFQFRAVVTPPRLEIVSPKDGSVVSNPVFVEGITDSDAYITINQDTLLRPDTSGRFSGQIDLPLGENTLTIVSTSRFDRSVDIKYLITVLSP